MADDVNKGVDEDIIEELLEVVPEEQRESSCNCNKNV